MADTLVWTAFGCAAVPTLLYLWNSALIREPPLPGTAGVPPARSPSEASDQTSPRAAETAAVPGALTPVSVLIPARNEELGIEACVRSVLASAHIDFEVIVLDDASTDRTAEIVRTLAAEDKRVRLESAPPLPEGWCGKQHACFALSKLARYDTFAFLDADVRLERDALARMLLFQRESGADLVSGFPKQETGTLLEKLLIPLINWVLLCFLPLWAMRRFGWSAFGAGCGQWFVSTRAAYEKVGGHSAVRASLHDGVTLPRAYRKAGFRTDLCDATHLATCRMYRSARAVWLGLAKNAREGMAATGQILFWSFVLFFGQVLPFALLVFVLVNGEPTAHLLWPALFAVVFAQNVRFDVQRRFRTDPIGLPLHPVAIVLLLAVQWYAVWRALVGKPVGWKGRTPPTAPAGREDSLQRK
jgi:glycosyltransferase involved in cell wall biosynthesis